MTSFSSSKKSRAVALRNYFSPFGNKLVAGGHIQPEQLRQALVQVRKNGRPLPEEIKNRWLKWVKEIKEVAKFYVHRYVFQNATKIPTKDQLELHGFADAGEQAWGIAIYLRFFNSKLNKFVD